MSLCAFVCLCHIPVCETHPSLQTKLFVLNHRVSFSELISFCVNFLRSERVCGFNPNICLTNRLATQNLDSALPDSITEWGVLAISASSDTGQRSGRPKRRINTTRQQFPHRCAYAGFCVAEPYNVRAWKRFFVDLRLPYSVARNEQVEIKAVIHNYGSEDMHVRKSARNSGTLLQNGPVNFTNIFERIRQDWWTE